MSIRKQEINDYLSYEQKVNQDVFQSALDAARVYDTEFKPKTQRNTDAEFSVTKLVEKISNILEKKINAAENILTRQNVKSQEYSSLLENFDVLSSWNEIVRIYNKPTNFSSRNQLQSEIMLLEPFLKSIDFALYKLIVENFNEGSFMADIADKISAWSKHLPRLTTSIAIYSEILDQVESGFYRELNKRDLDSAYERTIKDFPDSVLLEAALTAVETAQAETGSFNIAAELPRARLNEIINAYGIENVGDFVRVRPPLVDPEYSRRESDVLEGLEEEQEEEEEEQEAIMESFGAESALLPEPVAALKEKTIEAGPSEPEKKKRGRKSKAEKAQLEKEKKEAERVETVKRARADLREARLFKNEIITNLNIAQRDNDFEKQEELTVDLEAIDERIDTLERLIIDSGELNIGAGFSAGMMNLRDLPTPFYYNMSGNRQFSDDIF
jgi:hypothetical protein